MNPPAQTPASLQPPLFDLIKFVSILWQRRFLILAATLLLVTVAGIYVFVTKPIYTATAVILVDPRETRTTESDNVLSGLGTDSAAIASQVAVIGSRELLTQVFEDEQIALDPEFAESEPSLISRLLGRNTALTPNMIFSRFVSRVGVERQGLTYVLSITFQSRDPEKASRIANSIVSHYIASQISEKSAANSEVTTLLTSRIAGLQQSVSDAERAVEDFKIQYNIFDAGAGSTLLQSQIDQLNVQLLASQEEQRQAETQYEQAVAAGTSADGLQRLSEILSSSSADKLRDDYNQRVAAIASAQATLGPRHPTLVALQAELTRVESLIEAETQRITQELQAQLDRSADNVAKIESEIEALRNQSNETNRRTIELRQLQRTADAARTVLDQFQLRSQETGQLEGLQLSEARTISAATPPDQATWPKPMLLLGLAGLIGLAIGSAIALLLGLPVPRVRIQAAVVPRPETVAPVVMASARVRPAEQSVRAPVRAVDETQSERQKVKSAAAEIRRSINYARLN